MSQARVEDAFDRDHFQTDAFQMFVDSSGGGGYEDTTTRQREESLSDYQYVEKVKEKIEDLTTSLVEASQFGMDKEKEVLNRILAPFLMEHQFLNSQSISSLEIMPDDLDVASLFNHEYIIDSILNSLREIHLRLDREEDFLVSRLGEEMLVLTLVEEEEDSDDYFY